MSCVCVVCVWCACGCVCVCVCVHVCVVCVCSVILCVCSTFQGLRLVGNALIHLFDVVLVLTDALGDTTGLLR